MEYFSNRLVAEKSNKNVNLSPYNKLIGEWNFEMKCFDENGNIEDESDGEWIFHIFWIEQVYKIFLYGLEVMEVWIIMSRENVGRRSVCLDMINLGNGILCMHRSGQ